MVGLIVLASQPYDQYCPCIWVQNQVTKNLAGVLMIATQLATSVVVGKGDDTNLVRLVAQFVSQLLTDAVHTPDCRNNPQFITNAYIAVCATIAHEIILRIRGYLNWNWLVSIVE